MNGRDTGRERFQREGAQGWEFWLFLLIQSRECAIPPRPCAIPGVPSQPPPSPRSCPQKLPALLSTSTENSNRIPMGKQRRLRDFTLLWLRFPRNFFL